MDSIGMESLMENGYPWIRTEEKKEWKIKDGIPTKLRQVLEGI